MLDYLFMGSERGGQSAAIAYTLIETVKFNGAKADGDAIGFDLNWH